MAHLHSRGKGANKTPPDCVASGLPQVGRDGAFRRRTGVPGAIRSADGSKPARREEGVTVTTISAAEPSRRDFLYIATATVGAVGAAATLVPLVGQMNPDASTIAAGAPVEVDLKPIAEGQIVQVFWRSKPIFIFHRTKQDIERAQAVNWQTLRDPAPDSARVLPGHEQWLVVVGICTHLGCIPLPHQGNYDGWFCPCHGSQYDSAGRIRQGPAPLNLPLPPYQFVSDAAIRIGEAAPANNKVRT